MRHVLAIPLDEVRAYFAVNERQSLKIVAPERLVSAALAARLGAKPEVPHAGETWRHSVPGEPNAMCESGEFEAGDGAGFTISFGTEHGVQEDHVHRRHTEIYFSEHPLRAYYRVEHDGAAGTLELPAGGALVFGPGVAHRVTLGGLTIVIETPAVTGDKFAVAL
ncbi:MAG: hypothetical protein IT162_08210 [Bryobacterales bacterium]|nr:hypothetical protein [Bryobacterales bacterium]